MSVIAPPNVIVSPPVLTGQCFQDTQIVSFVPYIVFPERRSPQTGTFRTAHAVYENPAPVPAVIFRLGPPAPDQSAAVLLLLCWTWRVSDVAEAGLSLTAHFTLVTERMQAGCNKRFKTSQQKELQQIKAFFTAEFHPNSIKSWKDYLARSHQLSTAHSLTEVDVPS